LGYHVKMHGPYHSVLHSKKPPFGGFCELLLLIFLVAGVGFEPTTFRL
jgi:hypothetical protein